MAAVMRSTSASTWASSLKQGSTTVTRGRGSSPELVTCTVDSFTSPVT